MKTEQEFNRYSIALFDLEKAHEFAVEAQKLPPNSIVYEALVFSSIICYYRPFSPNERSKNPLASSQLKIKEFPPLSATEKALHDKCKSLRNTALAHSEYTMNPTRLRPATGVICSKPFSLLNQPIDLNLLTLVSG